LFDPAEKPEAFRVLLKLIHAENDRMDVGACAFMCWPILGWSIPRSNRTWIDAGDTALGKSFRESPFYGRSLTAETA